MLFTNVQARVTPFAVFDSASRNSSWLFKSVDVEFAYVPHLTSCPYLVQYGADEMLWYGSASDSCSCFVPFQ